MKFCENTLQGVILSASILGFSSKMYFHFLPQGGEVIFIIIPTFLFDFKNRTHIVSLLNSTYEHITILINRKNVCLCVCMCVSIRLWKSCGKFLGQLHKTKTVLKNLYVHSGHRNWAKFIIIKTMFLEFYILLNYFISSLRIIYWLVFCILLFKEKNWNNLKLTERL